MDEPKLSSEQQELFDLIENTNEHVFITGRAGTGKSTLLRYLAANTEKQIVIAAPTGVAALNVEGQTLHSLLRLPIGLIAGSKLDQTEATRSLLRAIDTLVIDEISMVNADVMDAVDRALRQARGLHSDPFGGVQIVMFGDPYQLAPVPLRGEERSYVTDHYASFWFFDARVWGGSQNVEALDLGRHGAQLHVRELQQIHRQSDPRFITVLNAVRHGQVTAPMAQYLNEYGAREVPDAASDDTPPIITLAARNDIVTATNARHLAALPGRSQKAVAEVNGEFGRAAAAYPADLELELKVGAQVMFLRNDTPGYGETPRWVNGSIGTVIRIAGGVVRVAIGEEEFDVEPTVWEKFRYDYDRESGEVSREVVAEFTQFPLRLAWAVTIHKAQGQSYDRAVIDLGSGAFAPGQTYVALSRLTSIEGLHLSRPLRPSDIKVDPDVARFMHENLR